MVGKLKSMFYDVLSFLAGIKAGQLPEKLHDIAFNS